MKVENRAVYIAEDGREFDSKEMCKRYETIAVLSKLLSNLAKVDMYYTDPIATALFDNFDVVIKTITENNND